MKLSTQEQIQILNSTFQIVDIIDCNFIDLEQAKIELHEKFQKNYKPAYDNDERIIIIIKKDYYSYPGDSGKLLGILQHTLQEIDISNFFVCLLSTNPDVFQEYNDVHKNVSVDPVPWTIYPCNGTFEKVMLENQSFTGKMQSFKKISGSLSLLSSEEKKLLFQDQVFCMMPWIGVNIEPDSDVRPCCEFQGTIGNLKTHNLTELWNSGSMKKIRIDMLNQRPPKECEYCYQKESLGRDSLRKSINRDFSHKVKIIKDTQSNGHLDSFNLGYLDIRYNNLCNLACRSCNSRSSSSWYNIHNHLYPENKITRPLLEVNDSQEKIFQEILDQIDYVEKIYFAGGEPLMIENFYRLLEILDAAGKNDVHLIYNTNLTTLKLKNYRIIDLWKKFKHISIGASLDAMGPRARYLRSGTIWEDVVSNANTIKKECPHVDFYVSATTGLINALHVAEFHRAWVNQGLITPEDFNIQILYVPSWMSLYRAPRGLKDKVKKVYQEHLKWLQPLDHLGRATSGFNSLIEICGKDDNYDQKKFWEMVTKFDQFYQTDLLDFFPELQDLGL